METPFSLCCRKRARHHGHCLAQNSSLGWRAPKSELSSFGSSPRKGSEWLALLGVHAARAWDVLCEQAPTTSHVEKVEKTAVVTVH